MSLSLQIFFFFFYSADINHSFKKKNKPNKKNHSFPVGKQTRLSVKEIEQNCSNCTGSEVSAAIGAPCEAGSVGNQKCIWGQRRLSLR